jgi:hypothetical protein
MVLIPNWPGALIGCLTRAPKFIRKKKEKKSVRIEYSKN